MADGDAEEGGKVELDAYYAEGIMSRLLWKLRWLWRTFRAEFSNTKRVVIISRCAQCGEWEPWGAQGFQTFTHFYDGNRYCNDCRRTWPNRYSPPGERQGEE